MPVGEDCLGATHLVVGFANYRDSGFWRLFEFQGAVNRNRNLSIPLTPLFLQLDINEVLIRCCLTADISSLRAGQPFPGLSCGDEE